MVNFDAVLFGVSGATLITSVVTVLMVALVHWVLHYSVCRFATKESAADTIGWRVAHVLRDTIPPLALLLWIYGLHYALTIVLADIPYVEFVRHATAMLTWLRGIGTVIALSWLLLRVGRGIEAHLVAMAARTDNQWDESGRAYDRPCRARHPAVAGHHSRRAIARVSN